MPPGLIGRGPGLCPRGGAGAASLPTMVSCARPRRSWGLAFALPFWRWWRTRRRGGRRLGAKRPERAWPGAFDPGPRSFVWLAGGAALRGRPPGRQTPPPPRISVPALPRPLRDRRIAHGRPFPAARALPLGRGAAAAFRGLGYRPRPRNGPAAGRSPAAGGWAQPTRRRPPRPRALAEGQPIRQGRLPSVSDFLGMLRIRKTRLLFRG